MFSVQVEIPPLEDYVEEEIEDFANGENKCMSKKDDGFPNFSSFSYPGNGMVLWDYMSYIKDCLEATKLRLPQQVQDNRDARKCARK